MHYFFLGGKIMQYIQDTINLIFQFKEFCNSYVLRMNPKQ